MKKILIITGTRAEYGLLKPIMQKISKSKKLELQLLITGTHLSPKFGMTINEIEKDGFLESEKIDMLLDSDTKSSIPKSMGLFMIQFSQVLDKLKPDIVFILGDRYEMLSVATCALMMNIKIVHMHGGEPTKGAIDDQIRAAITKMSTLHFATTNKYKDEIINMGTDSSNVFNVGATSVENIKNTKLLTLKKLSEVLKVKFEIDKQIFLITFHPVTLDSENQKQQINTLISALKTFDAIFIVTGANADFGGDIINQTWNIFKNEKENVYIFKSLGMLNYLSICKYAKVMIGNSSSGIIESPQFKLPTVNIGKRQEGRIRCKNIIDVDYSEESIKNGIRKACSKEFIESIKNIENPYGDGTTSEKIIKILEEI